MELGQGPDLPAVLSEGLPAQQAHLRILAVDDQPALTEVVTRMLHPDGHAVVSACSGEQALEELKTQSFDVVLSDLAMGYGMSGWDLAAQVREHWPEVRFILMSGWGARLDPDEARAKTKLPVGSPAWVRADDIVNVKPNAKN
jgi:CheY-like chemotaxis protein